MVAMTVDHMSPRLVRGIFDQVPGVAFFVKDLNLQYVVGSEGMLRLCGVARENQLAGRRSHDFFAHGTSQNGEEAEREIVRTGRGGVEAFRSVVRKNGQAAWLLIRRWPILDARRNVIGVAGLGRSVAGGDRSLPAFQRVARIAAQIQANFGEKLGLASIAAEHGVSLERIERDFVAVFGLTPRDYLTKTRLEAAVQMMRTESSIAEIAHACGYADQSAFSRRFKSATGMSPTEYKRLTEGMG